MAKGLVADRGRAAPGGRPPVDPDIASSSRRNGSRYLAEIAETVARLPRRPPTGWSPRPAGPSRWRAVVAEAERRGVDTGDLGTLAARLDAERDPEGRRLLEEWDALRAALTFDRRAQTTRPAEPGPAEPALWRTSLSGTRVPRVALPRFTEHGELLRWLRAEHLPGHFPFTAGVFPFKREGEDPARMFAGEGDAVPNQPALPPAGRGPAGDPPVDGLRLGDPVRLRPRRAPRHLRQGRNVRRLHRHPRRHEGPLRRVRPLRSDHVGVHDHQRPGPDHPGHVPQHGHRPARRALRVRAGPAAHDRRGRRRRGRGAAARCGARCRPTS